MSIFKTITRACPNCGTDNTFDEFSSVNADRRPDLRDAILSGEFQRINCMSCEQDFRLEPELNYLDVGRGSWIRAFPLDEKAFWDRAETDAATAFDEAYGSGAPEAAREIGDLLTVRATFGWPGFREKLLIADLGLNDVSVEQVKIAILRNREGNPLAPSIELRLLAAPGDELHFAWLDAQTGETVEMFSAPRALYGEIDGDPDWADIGRSISAGLFTDMQRLFLEPQSSDARDPELDDATIH